MKKRSYVMSSFHCPECDTILQVPRPNCKQREKGHIKDLYCPICKKVMKCMEIRHSDAYRNLDGEIVSDIERK